MPKNATSSASSFVAPSQAQVAEILRELDKADDEESLGVFLRAAWRFIDPAALIDSWHLDAIAEHLQAVTDGDIKRLIINQPPRTSKSSLVSVAWQAWAWAQRDLSPLAGPQTQWMFASYAEKLSLRDNVKARRLIESPWYRQLWGDRFKLTTDQNTKHRFENDKGGYRIATSVGGTVTGEGAQVIVVDDPHNTIESESELVVQRTVTWWDESLSTRLNDPKTGAFVLVMQRLSENDLTDHILATDRGEWCHLCLPMRYDPARRCVTVIGWEDPRQEDGELLCPERFGEAEIEELERRLGPFGTAGQLQQSPQQRGGSILKREWWQFWSRQTHPPYELVIAVLDTNQSQKEENDYSALVIMGVFEHGGRKNVMLSMAWRTRLEINVPALPEDERKALGIDRTDLTAWERDEILNGRMLPVRPPAPLQGEKRRGLTPMERARVIEKLGALGLCDKVAAYCDGYRVDRLLIENKANGFAVDSELRRQFPNRSWTVDMIDPGGKDKAARAHSIVPPLAAGLVWAPGSSDTGTFREWAEGVIAECAVLPRGKHDDRADCVVHGLRWLRSNNILLMTPEVQARAEQQRAYENRQKPKPLYPG